MCGAFISQLATSLSIYWSKIVAENTYKLFYLLFTGPHYINVRRKRKYFFKMVEVIGWLSHAFSKNGRHSPSADAASVMQCDNSNVTPLTFMPAVLDDK